MQPEFTRPDFMDGTSADDIHRRMMAELPDDIDDMPGGFPYDMTQPPLRSLSSSTSTC